MLAMRTASQAFTCAGIWRNASKGNLARSHRPHFKLSFLMMNIVISDFNDQYGHLVGDVVLQQVAETIEKRPRAGYSGPLRRRRVRRAADETDAAMAFIVADRIPPGISERVFKAYDEG